MEKAIYKKDLKFISADNLSVSVSIEIKQCVRRCRDYETLEFIDTYNSVSIMGEVGTIYSGQIYDDFVPSVAQQKLVEFWKKYHLNGLKAGTKRQSDYLESKKDSYINYDYEKRVKVLELADLYEDRGYKYGSDWLVQQIGENEISELKQIVSEIENETKEKNKLNKTIVKLDGVNVSENVQKIYKKFSVSEIDAVILYVFFKSQGKLVISQSDKNSIKIESYTPYYGARISYYGISYIVATKHQLILLLQDKQLARDMWMDDVANKKTILGLDEYSEEISNYDDDLIAFFGESYQTINVYETYYVIKM